jgi:hypothetical protein
MCANGHNLGEFDQQGEISAPPSRQERGVFEIIQLPQHNLSRLQSYKDVSWMLEGKREGAWTHVEGRFKLRHLMLPSPADHNSLYVVF